MFIVALFTVEKNKVYLCIRIPFSNKKKWNIDKCYNINEP